MRNREMVIYKYLIDNMMYALTPGDIMFFIAMMDERPSETVKEMLYIAANKHIEERMNVGRD